MGRNQNFAGTVVDLFAGCGGLSLGLERAGFEPIFVNELHPDALATYVANRAHLDVALPMNQSQDILELTRSDGELEALGRRLKKRSGGDVTLVVGGPPCQGYSGIGHRRSFLLAKEEIPSNHLYRDFASTVSHLGPRAFVFENVKGLLSSRWTPEGEKGEIWEDVIRTLRRIRTVRRGRGLEYVVQSKILLAKDFGVPQNRPRIIVVGVREDVVKNLRIREESFFPAPSGSAPDLVDALGDLVDPDWHPGGATLKYPASAENEWQRYFRMSLDGSNVLRKGSPLAEHAYNNHSPEIVRKFQYMLNHDGNIPSGMRTKKFAQRVLPERWGPSGPTVTATSLADDYVHFSQPRVPTIREWARLQMFPDTYIFVGKRSTGGRRRAGDPEAGDWSRDLPKYTQIGNAVAVGVAEALGHHLRRLVA